MFFILSRFGAWLASPLTYILLFAIAAVFVRSRKKRIGSLCSALFLSVFFSLPAPYEMAANAFVPSDPAVVNVDSSKHYVYGLIPGGITSYDSISRRLDFGETVDRISETVSLMKAGIVDTMIISGDGAPTWATDAFYYTMESVYGIGRDRILIEPWALNTYQNLQFSVAQFGLERLSGKTLVINSGIFMRRTILCAELVNLDADFYIVDYVFARRHRWTYYVPAPVYYDFWLKLLHEIVGYVSYSLVYS